MTKPVYRSPEEVYDLWIAALESGDYKQTTDVLKSNEDFCCLGVLCDLAIKDGASFRWMEENELQTESGLYGAMPPGFLCEYLGLTECDNNHVYAAYSPVKAVELAEMNDAGNTFEEIAKHIRKVIKPQALAYLKSKEKTNV